MRTPLAVLLLVACSTAERDGTDSVSARPPSGPVFEIGLWMGEGIPVIEAARDSIPLRVAPRMDAPVSGTLTVGAGRTIEYDSTVVQTLTPAPLRATTATTIRGRNFGPVRGLTRDQYYSSMVRDTVIAIGPSTKIDYLQDRAEGSCFVRVEGIVLEVAVCPVHEPNAFHPTGAPSTVSWVFARGGQSAGWLPLGDSTARITRRDF